ncbi:hypothetical protein Tco_0519846 [Tanacetum coccineum]
MLNHALSIGYYYYKNLTSPNHLSQIKNDETSDDSEVNDNFPGETLMELNTRNELWFADFANYLVSDIIPKGMTYQQKKKFFSDLKHYFWEEPYLFKFCPFEILSGVSPASRHIMCLAQANGSLEVIPSSKRTKLKCLQMIEKQNRRKRKVQGWKTPKVRRTYPLYAALPIESKNYRQLHLITKYAAQ